MDLEGLLKNQLDHLEASLRRLDGIEKERAGAGDLPFVHFGILALHARPGYEKVRMAFEDTFGPGQLTISKLGGDLGGVLLATAVRKLLAAGQLDSTKLLAHALYWVASLQEEVKEV